MTTILTSVTAKLRATIASLPKEDVARATTGLASFGERFPLSRLRRLSGVDLLEVLHGRATRDSLVYWLEFKNDDDFDTRSHGSIRGGSALKFVVYQSAEAGTWHTYSEDKATVSKQITAAEAAVIAERQRNELLAAAAVLSELSDDPDDPRYETLQADIEAAAPEFAHLAFFHKTLALLFPARLDDFHSTAYQNHVLASAGIEPRNKGLYSAAGHFVALRHAVNEGLDSPALMSVLGAALNRVYGPPVHHWRVGTGGAGEHWEQMCSREVIAIGWEALGDLADLVGGLKSKEGIDTLKRAIAKTWPKHDPRLVGREARQLWRFYHQMQEGDRVYVAYGQEIRGVGVIAGPYFHEQDDLSFSFRRRVRWLSTDPFRVESKAGLMRTVCSLDRALDLRAEVARHLQASTEADTSSSRRDPARLDGALEPIVTQLERKGQVVLYGPPGTGKTYRAQQAAEEIVARASHGRAWAELSAKQRGVLKGQAGSEHQRLWTCTFHPAYGYEDFVEGLRPRPVEGGLDFKPEPGLFARICEHAAKHHSERFVLVIDEFNRGDAPRIFGELLTLLELDKRERLHVELPLSGRRFTVPRNLQLIATMNTADRSISLLDAALRRRFGFVEYMPASAALGGAAIAGLALDELLRVINERLVQTLGDAARNLQVGHAYFMSEAQPLSSVFALRSAIRYDLFPLLQEYCAEDPNALSRILGDGFYDRRAQCFRGALFEPGNEAAFIEGLIAWAPERLTATVSSSDDEAEDEDADDDGDEHEDNDGAS